MSDIWTTSWSETDASNSQTPPEGWPAGMFPNAVEPAARMNMGAVKRFWNRSNAVYAAQWNTADSYVVSPSIAPPGYGLYERWRLRFTAANVSTSPSVNISSLGAQLVKKYDGSGNKVNPAAGDIQAQDHGVWWDGTNVILENPVTQTLVPGSLPNKASPTSSDSIVIGDAANSNAAAAALVSAFAASAAQTLTGTDLTKFITPGGFAGNQNVGSGYYKLPGGLLLEWGSVTLTSTTSETVTFPTTFASVAAVVALTTVVGKPPAVTALSTSNIQLAVQSSMTGAAYWLAIGN